jgi:hypothetical protein
MLSGFAIDHISKAGVTSGQQSAGQISLGVAGVCEDQLAFQKHVVSVPVLLTCSFFGD